ncbi:hypothetical protein J3L11_12890 [Shewanella sp. 4t3-1-2LB]|uniref:hypothetical protein n=1 Tax=Shewanella sp. 4t3-1-2LB TaxID=2817682 RepID=UPI001A98A97A|nr:hypothetical protein [Shewanella sp. 4t3-1-2LB]MBO1272541.1 hypothetical protein [Shewanella sp. 4t3-1-2LB]
MKLFVKNAVWLLLAMSAFLLVKSSDETVWSALGDGWLHDVFLQFDNGNSIIFNLSVGYIVSTIFYVLVVLLPEIKTKNELKKKLGQPISFVLEVYDKGLIDGLFHWSKHVIHCKPISEHLNDLDRFEKESTYKKLGEAKCIIIVQAADEILPTFEQLVPVAFQISHQHAMIWLSLTNSIRQLARLWPQEKEERDWGIIDLNLKEFIHYVALFYGQELTKQ